MFRPDEEEQPTPRQLEMLLEESGASSPDSGTGQPSPPLAAVAVAAENELEQLEALEREMEEGGGAAALVRRSVPQAERQRLEAEMAELERLEAEILQRNARSVSEAPLGCGQVSRGWRQRTFLPLPN